MLPAEFFKQEDEELAVAPEIVMGDFSDTSEDEKAFDKKYE